MIALGGSIGTGLFIGSGGALSSGGPGSVLIGFLLVGVMLFMVVNALGELACVFPVQGSFSIYSTRFLHPSWGFAMGWNYALQWVVTLPTELSSAVLVIGVSFQRPALCLCRASMALLVTQRRLRITRIACGMPQRVNDRLTNVPRCHDP